MGQGPFELISPRPPRLCGEDHFSLSLVKNPFRPAEGKEVRDLVPVDSLADLHREYVPPGVKVKIHLNGIEVEEDAWSSTYPRPGDFVVISAPLGGGDFFKMFLVFAITLVAWAALGPLGMGLSGFWLTAAVAGVSLIGGMIVNALLPPSLPKPVTDNNLNSTAYSWSPQNTDQQGTVVPKWYGRHRIYGQVIGSYIENSGAQNQYMNILVSLGLGPCKVLGDFKLNDQPVSHYQHVKIVTRYGYLDQPCIANFDSTKTEYPASVAITHTGGAYIYTTIGNNFDAIEVELTFPQGLCEVSDAGKYTTRTVTVRVEISPHGANAWVSLTYTPADTYQYATYGGNWDSGFYDGDLRPQWSIGYHTDVVLGYGFDGPIYYWYHKQDPPAAKKYDYKAFQEGADVDGDASTALSYHWMGPPPPEFQVPDGDYPSETVIISEDPALDYFKISGRKMSPVHKMVRARIAEADQGVYDVRITRVTADTTDPSIIDKLFFAGAREVINDKFQYPRQVLVSCRALATDQLSGSLRLSCLADMAVVGTCRDATPTAGAANLHTSGGSSRTVTTSDGAFEDLAIGDELIANGISRRITAKASNNEVTVHEAVNWNNGGSGYAFTWREWEIEWTDNPAWVFFDIMTQPVIDGKGLAQNALKWSEDITQVWTEAAGVTLRSNQYKDPYGTGVTGDKYTVAAGQSNAYLRQSVTGLKASTKYTFSFWIKKISGTITADANVRVRFSNSAFDSEYKNFGNRVTTRWKRFSFSKTTNSSGGTGNFSFTTFNNALTLAVWGFQVEEGDRSAYHKTEADNLDDDKNPFKIVRFDGIDPYKIDLVKVVEWAEYCDDLVSDGTGEAFDSAHSGGYDPDDLVRFNSRIYRCIQATNPPCEDPANDAYWEETQVGLEKRITFNGGFDYDASLWEAALRVGLIGRAVPVWDGSKLTLAIDKPADPVNLYTVGNIEESKFKETFLPMEERANMIEADFTNSAIDYERDKLTVYRPDVSTGPYRASLDLFGCVKPTEAYRHSLYRINCNRYLKRTVEIDVDIEALAETIGDVVNIAHDVPRWDEGLGASGRVVSATASTITLDKPVTIQAGLTYTVLVKTAADDVYDDLTVTDGPGTYTTLHITPHFDPDADPARPLPEQFDIYAFGQVETVVKPFRIMEMSRSQDQKITLTCIEYKPEIYSGEELDPPINNARQAALLKMQPKRVSLSQIFYKGPSGTKETAIDIDFTATTDPDYDRVEVWYRKEGKSGPGDWIFAGSTSGSSYQVLEVEYETKYSVALVPVDSSGNKLYIGRAKLYQIKIGGPKVAADLSFADATGKAPVSTITGGSTTVTTSDDAFKYLDVGDRITVGTEVRTVETKNSDNSVVVNEAVDWFNGGAGQAFKYDPPVSAIIEENEPLLFRNIISKYFTLDVGGAFVSSATYPRVEITKDHVAGFSDALTAEFGLDAATGRAFAGAGAVTLGSFGFNLTPSASWFERNSLTFSSNPGVGPHEGQFYCLSDSSSINILLEGNPEGNFDKNSTVELASNGPSSKWVALVLGAYDTNLHGSAITLSTRNGDAVIAVETDVLEITASLNQQLVSILPTGTAPFAVTSTTLCSNLNADQLDGNHAAAFAQLAGVAGGQTFYGGNAANDDLILSGTSHATKTSSYVILQPGGGNVGIGTSTPLTRLQVMQAGDADGIRVNGYDDLAASYGQVYVDASNYFKFGSTNTNGLRFSATGAGATVSFLTGGLSRFQIMSDGAFFIGGAYRMLMNSDGASYSARLNLKTEGDAVRGIVVRANSATQSASLQEWQTSAGAVLTAIDATGKITTTKTLVSTLAVGTKPVDVTSTTLCTNLNADLLDGNHAAAFALSGHDHNGTSPSFAGLTLSGAIHRDVNSDVLYVSGSDAYNAGANLALYGENHATLPSQFRFRVGTAVQLAMDASARLTLGIAAYPSTGTNVFSVQSGTAPSTGFADSFAMYSSDQAAGNACPTFRTENGAIIQLYQGAHITDADGTLAHATSRINAILTRLENLGFAATS